MIDFLTYTPEQAERADVDLNRFESIAQVYAENTERISANRNRVAGLLKYIYANKKRLHAFYPERYDKVSDKLLVLMRDYVFIPESEREQSEQHVN